VVTIPTERGTRAEGSLSGTSWRSSEGYYLLAKDDLLMKSNAYQRVATGLGSAGISDLDFSDIHYPGEEPPVS